MLQIRAIKGPTGRLLVEMLKQRGLLDGRAKGQVNYGYGGQSSLPTLNARAGTLNKYQELMALDDAGVVTVPFSGNRRHLAGTFLGRKLHHTQGKDIKINGAGDFYTELIPKDKEYRVWVFRNKALATYEKKLEYAQKYGRRGRSREVWNWHNGFAFNFVRPENVSQRLKDAATASIAALELDFGAVDIILGSDGNYYVLEVNSAPGTQGNARQGITSLVNCIERWAKNGFKERKHE